MDADQVTTNPPSANRGLILAIVFLLMLVATPLLAHWLTHNSLVGKQEAVDAAWAQVESAAQRRADLIPNLVKSVQRYLDHERETLNEITAKRMANTAASLAASNQAYQQAGKQNDPAQQIELQARLDQGTRALLAVVEDHPNLRSADQFLSLQAQLEGTENRLNIARMRYNNAARDYNSTIRGYLATQLGLADGMTPRPYFEAQPEAHQAPSLNFE